MSTMAVGFPHPRLAWNALSGRLDDSSKEYKSRVIGSRFGVVDGLQHPVFDEEDTVVAMVLYRCLIESVRDIGGVDEVRSMWISEVVDRRWIEPSDFFQRWDWLDSCGELVIRICKIANLKSREPHTKHWFPFDL